MSSESTGSTGNLAANARPWVMAQAVRRPVKEPAAPEGNGVQLRETQPRILPRAGVRIAGSNWADRLLRARPVLPMASPRWTATKQVSVLRVDGEDSCSAGRQPQAGWSAIRR